MVIALLALPASAMAADRCRPVPHGADDAAMLNAFWGLSVRLCRLPDGSADAYADADEGVVKVDQSWLDAIARRYGSWAATGILAHEWGHIVQGDVPGTAGELQADCLAGLFMRGTGQPRWAVEQFAASNFDSGDADWQEDGHGTADQRVAAALRGYAHYAGDRRLAALEQACPARAR